MVSVTAGLSDRLLDLVFGPEAATLGGGSLELLAIGFGGFAIFGVLTTVLNSLKHERESVIVTAVAVTLVVALCFWRVRGAPFGQDLLLCTAQATAAGLFVATLSAAFFRVSGRRHGGTTADARACAAGGGHRHHPGQISAPRQQNCDAYVCSVGRARVSVDFARDPRIGSR